MASPTKKTASAARRSAASKRKKKGVSAASGMVPGVLGHPGR